MKAAVYYSNGGPEVFRYEEIAPPKCSAQAVLIKVLSISIECGDLVDRRMRSLLRMPHVVGCQCAGEIIEVGAEVRDRHVGQVVVAAMKWGSHAEIALALARETWLVPDGLDIDLASTVPTVWGTANDGLNELGGLCPDETVLIDNGSATLGIAAVQLAKLAGARVIATNSNPEVSTQLLSLGADHVIDRMRTGYSAEVIGLTAGKGVDLLLGGITGSNTQECLTSLAYRGKLIEVGFAGGADKQSNPNSLWFGNKSVQGVSFLTSLDVENARVHRAVSSILSDITEDRLKVLIAGTYPLSEAAEAHSFFSDVAFGHVLLKPDH